MAKYSVQGPDGKVYVLEGPDGASTDDVMKAAQALAADHQTRAAADLAQMKTDYAPTVGMGTTERTAAGVGQGINNVNNGIGQMVGKVLPEKGSFLGVSVRSGLSLIPGGDAILGLERSQSEIDEAKRTDAPLLKTTAGRVGSAVGNVAAALPTLFIPGINRYAGAAALGGVTGALQPVASDESRLANTAIGAAAGPLGVGAARVVGGVVQAGRAAVQPLYQAGRDQIAGNILARFASDPAAIANASSRPTITGALPTLAEQTGDVGLSGLQTSLRTLDPQINNAISARLGANNAARVNKLNELAGDTVTGNGGARDFAVANRAGTAGPMYEEALSAVPDAAALTAEQARTLGALMKSPAIQSAMKDARTIAQNNGTNVGTSNASGSVEGLHNMKLAMDDQIAAATNAGNSALASSIKSAQQKLVGYIESVSPEYKNARGVYADMSKPINSMDVAAQVARKGLSNGSDLSGTQSINRNALLGAMRDEPRLIQQATGRTGLGNSLSDVMEPADENMLRAIASESDRAGAVATAGNGAGSATAKNMASQNIINSLIGPLGAPGGVSEGWMRSLADSVLARGTVGRALGFVYNGAEPDIQQTLARAVLDPDSARSVLEAAMRANVRLPPSIASRLALTASQQGATDTALSAAHAP